MFYDRKQAEAYDKLQLARRRLRECEAAFEEHLADDPLPWIDEIARAERQVAQARARVHAMVGGAP
jgi:hypothetical protein